MAYFALCRNEKCVIMTSVDNSQHTTKEKEMPDNVFSVNKIELQLPNESTGSINVQNAKFYRGAAGALIAASREVRQQPLFPSIDLDELTAQYPITPFAYQRANVEIMLNQFDGRGVFGDQVGLGKTFQALMCAHAMFASGAIRNAFLVVPTALVGGWLQEIDNKFPNLFRVTVAAGAVDVPPLSSTCVEYVTGGEGEDKFLKLLRQMDAENSRPASADGGHGFRLYLTTEEMLKCHNDQITNALNDAQNSAFLKRHRSTDAGQAREQLMRALVPQRLSSVGYRINVIDELSKLGFYQNGTYCAFGDDAKPALECLQAAHDWIARNRLRYPHASAPDGVIEQAIAGFEQLLREQAEIKERSRILEKLCGVGGERIVDLLIVDEIHRFYIGEAADGVENENSGAKRKTVELLANIRKKFCVLVSATPIRTSLEDVFDLLYIIDKTRMGQDEEQARAYFYKTVCGVRPDERFKLNAMLIHRPQSFFGLINNYFTRKRIHEVGPMMQGHATPSLTPASIRSAIVARRTLTYLQTGSSLRWSRDQAAVDVADWSKGSFGKNEAEQYRRRHTRDAIDAVLIDRANDSERSVKARQAAHASANWNRRSKRGVAVCVPLNPGEQPAQSLITGLCRVMDSAAAVCGYPTEAHGGELAVSNCGRVWRPMSACVADLEDVCSALCHDAVLCYVSRDREGDMRIRNELRENLTRSFHDVKVEACDGERQRTIVVHSEGEVPSVDLDQPNPFCIVNRRMQAGANLQEYTTLVFAQMDYMGRRLLEPVDIEQWIGRIHRTAQTKTARIVTVLTTAMIGKNPTPEFLKWYYSVLADPLGFDLYGDNTPDVAFLQPVVTDMLRAKLTDPKTDTPQTVRQASQRMGFSETQSPENLPFGKLLWLCYEVDQVLMLERKPQRMKRTVEQLIRELCSSHPQFGKKGVTLVVNRK